MSVPLLFAISVLQVTPAPVPSRTPAAAPQARAYLTAQPFPHPPTGWTAALTLSSQGEVRFDEPASIHVVLTNIDSKMEYINAPDTTCSYHLALFDKVGIGGDDSFGGACPVSERRVRIEPGQTKMFSLPITDLVDWGNPGQYAVRLMALNACAAETGPCELVVVTANQPPLTVLPEENYGSENNGFRLSLIVTPQVADTAALRTVHVRVMNVSGAPQRAGGDVCNFEVFVVNAATGAVSPHYHCTTITHIFPPKAIAPGDAVDVHFTLPIALTEPGRYYVVIAAIDSGEVIPVASNAAILDVTRQNP